MKTAQKASFFLKFKKACNQAEIMLNISREKEGEKMVFTSVSLAHELENGSLKGDPFSVLGMHESPDGKGLFIRTMQPQAKAVEVFKNKKSLGKMTRILGGIFQLDLPKEKDFFTYTFEITLSDDSVYETDDPYRFLPVLGDMDRLSHKQNHPTK